MTPEKFANLVSLRRVRDQIDANYAQALDVAAMASMAAMSSAHFSRSFRASYGEAPYFYLQTRRIERAKALLRKGESVTDTCLAVGYLSLGSFSTLFRTLVGESPSKYRQRDNREVEALPTCVKMMATRPRHSSTSL